MNMLYFGAGFARPFFGCIFPNFCGVIQFYEIKLEVEVDFCMFLVVYMFSKQIWYWNRIGRQLLGGFELADELADSFNPVRLLAFERLINTLNRISQKERKKNTKADDKSKSDYFSWSDDGVQLLLNVYSNQLYKSIEDDIDSLNERILPQIDFFFGPIDKM